MTAFAVELVRSWHLRKRSAELDSLCFKGEDLFLSEVNLRLNQAQLGLHGGLVAERFRKVLAQFRSAGVKALQLGKFIAEPPQDHVGISKCREGTCCLYLSWLCHAGVVGQTYYPSQELFPRGHVGRGLKRAAVKALERYARPRDSVVDAPAREVRRIG